jgi:hypothetical protein
MPAKPGTWFGRALAFIASTALLIAGLMFSLVVVSVLLVAGVATLGYFYWKTRRLRKAMREAGGQQTIDGEACVVVEETPLLEKSSGIHREQGRDKQ